MSISGARSMHFEKKTSNWPVSFDDEVETMVTRQWRSQDWKKT